MNENYPDGVKPEDIDSCFEEEGVMKMNENEIVEYLKQNKEKGVAFDFMPHEVANWCREHSNEEIFHIFHHSSWNGKCDINCRDNAIYCLDEDYEPKPKFEPHWEEFGINKDGMLFIIDDNDKICHYHWWDWVGFLNHHHDKFNNFGGYVYKELPQKSWQTFPVVAYDEEEPPISPTKVRFWRYKE